MMNKLVALLLSGAAIGAAHAQANVSISVHQPGVYGRIDIGPGLPPPPLVLPQPVIIAPPPVAVQRAPIYLYVPPAHQHDWRRYCGRYAACGQPVYFVQDRWVRERWDDYHRHHDHGRHRGWDKHDHDRHDHHDHDRKHGHDRH